MKPYMLSYGSVVREGDSGVLEVPISAFVFPFIGTVMRLGSVYSKDAAEVFILRI